jgi:hypothetical protein
MKLIRRADRCPRVEPDEVLARVSALAAHAIARAALRLELDELRDVVAFARRDLIHLDADALNDRLHAWTHRDVAPILAGGSAYVSFRHARPATREEATLDLQERWLDLEPTFRLHTRFPTPTAGDVATYARLIPAFLALVDAAGGPAGWRRVDEGVAE